VLSAAMRRVALVLEHARDELAMSRSSSTTKTSNAISVRSCICVVSAPGISSASSRASLDVSKQRRTRLPPPGRSWKLISPPMLLDDLLDDREPQASAPRGVVT
jgi:hypothetical protein